MIIGKLTIQEPLGIFWPRQYVCLQTALDRPAVLHHLMMTDPSGIPIDADFLSLDEESLTIGLMLSLNPNETLEYIIFEQASAFPCFAEIAETDGVISVRTSQFTCDFPSSGTYSAPPPPILRFFNETLRLSGLPPLLKGDESKFVNEFRGASQSADGGIPETHCAVLQTRLTCRPLTVQADLRYAFTNGGCWNVTLEFFKDTADLKITESFSCKEPLPFTLRFNQTPHKIYARMHSPSAKKGRSDEWKRIEYTPTPDDAVRLQPFYTWDTNTATLMQLYFMGNTSLCAVPVCASQWKNGKAAGPVVKSDQIELPVSGGARVWVLSLCFNDSQRESVKLTSAYQNWENMLKNPMDKIRPADTLCAVYGSPSLEDALAWNRTWKPADDHPHLLLQKQDIPHLRGQIQKWPWLRKALSEHKDDPNGFDPAGVYLLSGEDKYAEIAKTEIAGWLRTRIRLIADFGYSLHELVCIRLSRPLRLIALDFDLIADSPAVFVQEKVDILRQFAFLAHCMADPDYWPPVSAGFSKGNRNFHSDHFSALGTLACLLKGHPDAEAWASYVEAELDKELDYAVYPGGAWIEAPNYQAYSMNYLIFLFTALKNSGHRDFSADPRFLSAMDFLASIQTPPDIRCGIHLLPTVGDTAANYWTQSFQNVFAWAANLARDNPEFSSRMMRAWNRAGQPVINAGGELNSTFKTIALIDRSLAAAPDELPESRHYPEFGACMRSETGYLLLKAGKASMHYDHDEGSIIWYEKGVPILADIGSQYFPPVDAAFLHNRISVGGKTDECRGCLRSFTSTPEADFASVEVHIDRVQEWPLWPNRDPDWNFRRQPPPEQIPPHRWMRDLVWHKPTGALLIRDRVTGNLPFDQNFLFYANASENRNGFTDFSGQFGVDIAVRAFGGDNDETFEWSYDGLDEPMFLRAFGMDWRSYRWLWEGEMKPMGEKIILLRTHCAPNSSCLTFLYPHEPGEEIGTISPLPDLSGIKWKTDREVNIPGFPTN